MKILVVGGGVAGVAFASFMQNDAEVTIIDKTPQWGDIGYAITLWGNGRKILEKLKIEKEVVKESYDIPWNAVENKKGSLLTQFNFNVFHSLGSTIVITRTNLHKALISKLGESVKVRLGLTVSNIINRDKDASVTFSNGETEIFDLVIGADGIHSQIREMIFGKNYLKYYGWTVWGFWTPKGLGSPRGVIEVVSGGKMYFVYPMEDRAVILLATTDPSEVIEEGEKRREKLHAIFSDFKNSVGVMIDAIEDPAHIFHDKLAYIEMPLWYKDRVVLMGDAQHATSPITGMGASMALEDAFVLSEELKKINKTEEISNALNEYTKRRSKRIKEFRRKSRVVQDFMMVKSPFVSLIRNIVVKIIPISYFLKPIESLIAEEI